jgi:hypothetical protein
MYKGGWQAIPDEGVHKESPKITRRENSMSTSKLNQVADAEIEDSRWKSLYKVGGVAALVVLAFIPIQMVIFFVWPPPSTVLGWFTLFQDNALVGLLDMDLLLIIDYALMGILFLALWTTLRRASQSFMSIALTSELVGVTTYFASAVAFEMLSLSNLYAAAATDEERSIFLAAGQAMLATWQGTAFNVSYILSAIALLIVSVVMLRSHVFSKTTAYVGIIASVLMFVPPTVGTVGLYLSIVSLIPTIIWLILIARRLFRLGQASHS